MMMFLNLPVTSASVKRIDRTINCSNIKSWCAGRDMVATEVSIPGASDIHKPKRPVLDP
ncbi:hypothetical protein J6590_042388 [Homalodisca vitripennis]|nr:hypothetical protein J6590_042388 [Homalodisca vitripennis]